MNPGLSQRSTPKESVTCVARGIKLKPICDVGDTRRDGRRIRQRAGDKCLTLQAHVAGATSPRVDTSVVNLFTSGSMAIALNYRFMNFAGFIRALPVEGLNA